VISFRTAFAGIAAIVVLVFAGAGAATLFSSSTTGQTRAVAAVGPQAAIKLAFGGRFDTRQAMPARVPGQFRGLPGQAGGAFFRYRALTQVLGRVAGRVLGAGSCRLHVGIALFAPGQTLAARLSRKNFTAGVGPLVASLFGGSARSVTVTAGPQAGVVPLVASLFGSSARNAVVTGGAQSAAAGRAKATVRLCATPVPMSRLPGAGSPGTSLAPQTSLLPPPG
jgi:hypothetical protein